MDQVRAKLKCNAVVHHEQNKEVHMQPVCSNKPEDADFTKYTPWGDVKLGITNEAPASEFFKPGKTYYATFEEAPEE